MTKKWVGVVLIAAIGFSVGERPGRAQTAGACPRAQPSPVATGIVRPVLAADDQFLYYIGESQDRLFSGVFRVDKDGGTPEQLIFISSFELAVETFDVEVDAQHIYVMNSGYEDRNDKQGFIGVHDKEGQFQHRLEIDAMMQRGDCHVPFLNGMTLSPNGDVYFSQKYVVDHNSFSQCKESGQDAIGFFPAGATTATFFSLAGGHVVPDLIVADARNTYWADQSGIRNVSATENDYFDVASFPPVVSLALDATNVYWSWRDTSGPATLSMARVGSPLPNTLSGSLFYDLTSDGTYLFGNIPRADGTTANLTRMKPNGHGTFAIARSSPGALVVDDTFAYYLDATQTQIMRACKLAGL